MIKHIMVDIETLSTAKNAVVLSIGAVFFDPKTGTVLDEFYKELRLSDQANRKVDVSTVQWWVNQVAQHPERASIFSQELNGNKCPTRNALLLLRDFIESHRVAEHDLCVWACDPDFDLDILATLYADYDLNVPWKYYEPKSVRTIRMLGKELGLPKLEEQKTHNALEDCIRQAKEVHRVYSNMGVK